MSDAAIRVPSGGAFFVGLVLLVLGVLGPLGFAFLRNSRVWGGPQLFFSEPVERPKQ
jgi:phage-related minor tail protein